MNGMREHLSHTFGAKKDSESQTLQSSGTNVRNSTTPRFYTAKQKKGTFNDKILQTL